MWLKLDTTVLAAATLVALVLDRGLGEPPARVHPVVWMGRLLEALGRRIAPPAGQAARRPALTVAAGALAWLAGTAVVVALAWWGQRWAQQAPAWVQAIVLGVALKPMLAWRMLRDEVAAVEAALAQGLEAARDRLSRLVSRETRALDAAQVRQAALSTLAENVNDSVVAPLLWWWVAGLPGAALYRWANTADAMWGYRGAHGGRDWTHAGRWAARADDVLSWWPARLSAVLLALSARRWPGWSALRREAARTPSPNGGWPMGALALLLGVRLDKPGVYALNPGARAPAAEDVPHALRWAERAVAWWGVAAAALLALALMREVR
ncbi:MAG: adenosylcobinamide-phosphate synthase CbiB [Tepidimonas ignava]|uniref:adenosylcobinamide-phosphate synthase CbiB n=1 Tax=Tepidimonas ignava TaxID=114249 RepID=UPI002A2A3016|nr:adenosylcobinamide-phosphate synthase CbiB [Tepidimonas ignava]